MTNEVVTPDDMRGRVESLQAALLEMPQYEPETTHVFHGGMYCRQVWRPAGTLIVGKIHKKEHFYMVVYGTVAVTTDDGVELITGPRLLCSRPGTKRAVYAETDALCVTFHRTDAVDVETVESEVVEDDPTSAFTHGNALKAEFRKELT